MSDISLGFARRTQAKAVLSAMLSSPGSSEAF